MIKQDMSIELASLLSACPSIRNLKYVKIKFLLKFTLILVIMFVLV